MSISFVRMESPSRCTQYFFSGLSTTKYFPVSLFEVLHVISRAVSPASRILTFTEVGRAVSSERTIPLIIITGRENVWARIGVVRRLEIAIRAAALAILRVDFIIRLIEVKSYGIRELRCKIIDHGLCRD